MADEVDWLALPDSARSRKYEEWTRQPEVGGVLSNYIDPKRVRVYLKDSIIKPYTIARTTSHLRPFRALGLSDSAPTVVTYLKPHGRRLKDGRVVCWGQARDWKMVLLAVWERAYDETNAEPYGAVLTGASGQWSAEVIRQKAQEVAERLSISRLVWLEV
jgi:hypothetical protein